MSGFPGRGREKVRLRGSIGLCLFAGLISASSVAFLPSFKGLPADPAIQSPKKGALQPQLALSIGAYAPLKPSDFSSMKLLGGFAGLLLVAALRPQISRPLRSRAACSVAFRAQATATLPVASLRQASPVYDMQARQETLHIAEVADLLGLHQVSASFAVPPALPASAIAAAASPAVAAAAVSAVLAAPASCDFAGAAALTRGMAARRIGRARAPRSRCGARAGGGERQQRRAMGARLQGSPTPADPYNPSFDASRTRLQVQLGLLGLHQTRPLRGRDREASVSLSMLGNCPMKSSRLRIMTGFLHGNRGI